MRFWTALFIIALSAGSASAMVSDEATLQAVEAYTKGQEAAQKKDWDTAIASLEKALTLNPELYAAHFYVGYAYLAKLDKAKGLEHLKTFVEKMEGDAGSATMVAQARQQILATHVQDKNWVEAIPLLQKAVEAKPDDVPTRKILAQALLATKDEAGAEEQLVKLMELDPKSAPVFFQAGSMAYARKDDAAAKTRLDAFVALTPEGPQAARAYFMLGKIAQRANDMEAAKAYFEKYVGTNPPPSPQVEAVKQLLESLKAGAATAPPPAQ